MGMQALPFVIFFTVSLFVSSLLIGYFATEMCGLKTTAIVLPDTQMNGYTNVSSQDFTKNVDTSVLATYGTWSFNSGVGYILNSNPILSDAAIYINNVQKDNLGIVTMNYHINNSPLNSYTIILYDDAFKPINNNFILVKEDGFHIPASSFKLFDPSTWGSDKAFIPYPNANKVQYADITTKYDQTNRKVILTFNGNSYEFSNLNEYLGNSMLASAYNEVYGGVICNSKGFTFVSYHTDNAVTSANYSPGTIDTLSSIWSTIKNMGAILIWYLPDSIMPATIQLFLIKTQEFCLFVAFLDWIRG